MCWVCRYNKEDTGKVEEELGGGGAESKGREEEVRETAMDGAEISFAPVAKDHKNRGREGES